VRFGAALAPEVMSSLNDPGSFVDELIGFFDRVNAEDKRIVEGLFEGTAAPLARPGRLSWLEREIHDFMGYLARGLCQEQAS
jgi:choline monooxygenase